MLMSWLLIVMIRWQELAVSRICYQPQGHGENIPQTPKNASHLQLSLLLQRPPVGLSEFFLAHTLVFVPFKCLSCIVTQGPE